MALIRFFRTMILVLAATLLSITLYAQSHEKPLPKNELAITLLTCLERPTSVIYEPMFGFSKQYPIIPFGKITYKRHLNRHILRLSVNYRMLELEKYGKNYYAEGVYKETMLKIGYERELFSKKKLSPYFATDLLCMRSFAKGNGYDFFTKYEVSKVSQTGFGFSPAIGLRYKITPRFSLSLETSMDIYNTWYKESTITDLGGERNYSSSELNILANPINNFSLDVKF